MGLVFVFVLLLWAWIGERVVVCLLYWFLFGFVLGGLGFFLLCGSFSVAQFLLQWSLKSERQRVAIDKFQTELF